MEKEIAARQEQGLLRILKSTDSNKTDFSSNDYLGLSRSESFLNEVNRATKEVGMTGSTGSRLLTGHCNEIALLEEQIAGFHKAETSLLFPTGYMANVALISALCRKGVTAIIDQHVHASIRDGLRMAGAKYFKFRHNDTNDLERLLLKSTQPTVVVVDAVYSMEGDLAPLNEIAGISTRYGAELVVDEAHAIGIFGQNGRGLVSGMGLENMVMARVMTYGKAPGVQGGAIVCGHKLKQYLINFARPLIFSTAPSPLLVAAISASYSFFPGMDDARKKLFYLMDIVNESAGKYKLACQGAAMSPVIPVLFPGNKAKEIADRCNKAGYNVRPILSPTVAKGQERVRIILHAYNTENELRSLLTLLADE